MPNPIPTLGYPSRTEAVVALHSQGIAVKDIAAQIGINEERAQRIIRVYGPDKRTNMSIERSLLLDLEPAANRRRTSSRMLAIRIIRTVVNSGLIDAVLDDEPTLHAKRRGRTNV